MSHIAKISARLAVLGTVVLIAASPLAAQAGKTYRTRLSPVPMDLAMAATIAGSGSVTAVLNGSKLTVTGTFDGLKSPATIVQLHKAQRGVRGPAILDLKATSGTSGTISGTLDLTRTAGAGSAERPALRAAAQREGARRQFVGMVAAPGDKAMTSAHLRALATAALAVSGAVVMFAGQQGGAPVYSAEQAAAGRTAYQANCASCHLPDLGGRNEAPALAGPNFMSTWGTRTTKDLFDYMSATMPPSGSSLTEDQYASIVAFVLQSNGAAAGPQAFSAATAVPISSVATGRAPQPAAQAAAAAPAGGRGQAPAGGRGGRCGRVRLAAMATAAERRPAAAPRRRAG